MTKDKPLLYSDVHQTIEIFLSILLAAATAHVLQVFATISKLDPSSWFLFTIITVIAVALLITYIINKPSSEKIAGTITILKGILIFVVTITLFALARFVSFYFDEKIQLLNVRDMFTWVWALVLGCGILLVICTIIEFLGEKNHKYIILAIFAGLLIIIASCMLTFGGSILQLRGIAE